jgi:membrane-bound lytic murein transglycosylase D
VNRGDTITAVAARYGVTPQEVRGWNGLTQNQLAVGQRLRITSDLAPSASRVKRAGGRPGKPKSLATRSSPGSAKGAGAVAGKAKSNGRK